MQGKRYTLTAKEAAELIGVSSKVIGSLYRNGKLPARSIRTPDGTVRNYYSRTDLLKLAATEEQVDEPVNEQIEGTPQTEEVDAPDETEPSPMRDKLDAIYEEYRQMEHYLASARQTTHNLWVRNTELMKRIAELEEQLDAIKKTSGYTRLIKAIRGDS